MKKIMVISPQPLIPPKNGGMKFKYNLLKGLSEYYEVHYVMGNCEEIVTIEQSSKYLSGMKGIIFERHRPSMKSGNSFIKCAEGLKWLISNKPRAAQTIQNKCDKDKIMKYITENGIEIVVLVTPYSSEYVNVEFLRKRHIKVLLIEENLEKEFVKDLYIEKNIFKRIDIKRVEKYEKRVIDESDFVICISPKDCALLDNEVNNVSYIPVCYESSSIKWENEESSYILFSGSLSFPHNYNGIKWFIENVFLQYKMKYPQIILKITGDAPEKIKREFLKHEGIVFTGFLSDQEMEKMLSGCLFLISPIITGAGVKIKLIEALSMGIPVVATAHCEEGVPLNDINAFLVSRDEREFLSNMYMLTESRRYREELSKNALRFFENNYNVKKIIMEYRKIIDKG